MSMSTKHYVADSMEKALEQVRADLGADAVILSSKEIVEKKMLGLVKKKKYEVIAASEWNNVKPNAKLNNRSFTKESKNPSTTFERKLATLTSAVAEHTLQQEVTSKPSDEVSPLSHASKQAEVKQNLASTNDESMQSIQEQMQQMKQWIGTLVKEKDDTFAPLKQLEQKLKKAEVSEAIIESLTLSMIEHGSNVVDSDWEDLVKQKLHQILTPEKVGDMKQETKMVHVVGPTGVGKTTTLAKLAANEMLKGKKVGFITSDTFRIAAVEQMKTYAKILNAPCEIVNSPKDVEKAYHKLTYCDIIFMDTTGKNFCDEVHVSETISYLNIVPVPTETFLVVSLNSKYSDMKIIIDNFSKFQVDKIIFTKADETNSLGTIVNVAHDFPYQLSYITFGQNVPDDIALVDPNKVVDSLLKDN
ncbi:flagellar biosynthesis protein FlhF [Longirhabdus pacifica]|uniref:flagellar biosynthesis protein FlhF n=1 Tax=Longirhabdus pacifica TaxID=2305227 RepID=UPI001008F200|nr:flagellar biosynthesis protein FlhF [Longirhabdus pacifica]